MRKNDRYDPSTHTTVSDKITCDRCGGIMSEGVALQDIYSGSSEWSDGDMSGATLSHSGAAKMVKVMKCAGPTGCGHSYKI